jgi:hypothetical protein
MEFVLIVISFKMKKSKNIIVSVLLAALLLFTAFQLGLFTPYNYFTAKRDVLVGKIQLIEYGEPMLPTTDTTIHKLEDSPGYKTISLGCVITTQEINGIEQYNYVMEEFLNRKRTPTRTSMPQ